MSPDTFDCVECCKVHYKLSKTQHYRYLYPLTLCFQHIVKNKISETMSLTSHKSLASIEVPGSRPRSDQDAVTIAFDELLFNKTTASLLSLRGPAQTCTIDLLSHMVCF